MREIKFRCWDRVDKCMKRVHALDFSEWWVATNYYGGENGVCDGERNSFKNEETDRHILMQYTGVKDDNGADVYEGDIVSGMEEERCDGHLINVNTWIGECRYDNDKKRLMWFDLYEGATYEIDDYMFENVIGNIHENPELMEVAQ